MRYCLLKKQMLFPTTVLSVLSFQHWLRKFQHSVFDYAKADFDGLRASLNAFGLSAAIADNRGIDTDWQIWKDTFLASVVDNIPPKTLRGHNPVPCKKDAILTPIKKKEKVNL